MPKPNEHGVYDPRDAERLTLPNTRKGWLGAPVAEIALLEIEGGWLSSLDITLPSRGMCGPLSVKCGLHPTRADALQHQVSRVQRYCAPSGPRDTDDTTERNRLAAWAASLGAPQQIDMFA